MKSKIHTPQLALVTGATSGIGLATAQSLAEQGVDLILTGRRKERLSEVAKKIKAKNKIQVHTWAFDISSRKACEEQIKKNLKLVAQIDLLVNNAGLAKGTDNIQDAQIADWETMIDTNIKGLLYMTRLVVPHMVKRKTGHIVNLGSVAGRWLYPKGNVYCATKFAVRAISEGLRMDLLGTGVRVTNIAPGMVETEFSEVRWGDKQKAKKVYEGMKPLTAGDIADAIVWSVSRPAHVNIQEIIIYPTDQASVQNVHRS
jgi:3-hydroxy acid dehydrogenase / malonic semialdehyde reductase